MVWVDNTAVGRMPHSTPIAERTGRATVMEQRPTQEMSCSVMIRFILSEPPEFVRIVKLLVNDDKSIAGYGLIENVQKCKK